MRKRLIYLYLVVLSCACGRIGDDKALTGHHRPEIDSLQNKAERSLVNNFNDNVENTIDSLIALRGSISNLQLARAYSQKTYISNVRKRDFATALLYTDTILEILEPIKNLNDKLKNEYLLALFAKGDINYSMGKYQLAFYYFVQARREGEGLVNSCVNADYDYRMAMILYKQERYEEAIRYFHSTLEQQARCNTDMIYLFRKQELLNNIGLSYTRLQQYDSAMKYYGTALDYIKTKEDKGQMSKRLSDIASGVIMGNEAKVFHAKGDTARALNALAYNIRVNDAKGGDVRDALSSIIYMAEIYQQQGRTELLHQAISRAQFLLDSIPNPAFQRRVYRLVWKYHQMMDKQDIALQYAEKYISLNDSLNIVEKKLQNTDAQLSMEQLEKEFDLGLLKKDIQVRKNLTALFITIAILSLLILIIIFFSLNNTRKKNKLLEQLNQDKDRIMGIVAHDLRNPISAVYSLNEMMLESLGNEKTEQHEFLKMIKTACNSSLELINEILFMAEMSGNKSQVRKESVDVNEFLSTAINLIRFRAEEKHQEIEPDLLVISRKISIDPEKFRRVISNLITNAIKFSPEGSKIIVSAEVQNEELLISVKDEGIGIPQQIRDQIFEPFTTAKRNGTSGEKPFGLGLSIARQIVESHKGRVWFENGPKNGTIFYITVPFSS